MSLLMISNLNPETTEDQVKEFLSRYGFPPFDEYERQEGDGTRPAVTLTFHEIEPETLSRLQPRIHGVFWNGHKINALILRERFT